MCSSYGFKAIYKAYRTSRRRSDERYVLGKPSAANTAAQPPEFRLLCRR